MTISLFKVAQRALVVIRLSSMPLPQFIPLPLITRDYLLKLAHAAAIAFSDGLKGDLDRRIWRGLHDGDSLSLLLRGQMTRYGK